VTKSLFTIKIINMQQKILILFISLLLILSSAYLFNISEKKQDLDAEKNWWIVYFQEPISNDLTFSIENHTQNTSFSWEVFSEKNKIDSGNETIEAGKIKKINYTPNEGLYGKITIQVSVNGESKEIYKNIN